MTQACSFSYGDSVLLPSARNFGMLVHHGCIYPRECWSLGQAASPKTIQQHPSREAPVTLLRLLRPKSLMFDTNFSSRQIHPLSSRFRLPAQPSHWGATFQTRPTRQSVAFQLGAHLKPTWQDSWFPFFHLPRLPVGSGDTSRMPEPEQRGEVEMAAWMGQKLFVLVSRTGKPWWTTGFTNTWCSDQKLNSQASHAPCH